MKIIDKMLRKIVNKYLDEERKKRNDSLINLSEFLWEIEDEDLCLYQSPIKRVIREEISKNVTHFFYWFKNYYWDRQKDIIKDIVEEEIKKSLRNTYKWQIKEKLDKYVLDISKYDITFNDWYKNFVSNYINDNKVDITIKTRELLWSDEFFEKLCNEVWTDIWYDIRSKLDI